MAKELTKLLDEHQSDLTKLSQNLLDGDSNAFTAGLSKLLVTISTGIPALGALAKQGVSQAFARSTQAQLERELAKLAKEDERQEFAELVAGPIEELIGQALLQLVRVHNRDTEVLVEELGGVRAELEAFRVDFASRIEPETVVVDEIDVSGGIGVVIKANATSRLRARLIRVKKGTGLVLN